MGCLIINTTEIIQHNFHLHMLYLMSSIQLCEETLPVLRVIVDSEEALHINVGQQPVMSTKHHIWVSTCLNEYKTHCCSVFISLQCSDYTLEINLTCLFKEPVLLFSTTSLNPCYRDKPLITRASIQPYMQTESIQSS